MIAITTSSSMSVKPLFIVSLLDSNVQGRPRIDCEDGLLEEDHFRNPYAGTNRIRFMGSSLGRELSAFRLPLRATLPTRLYAGLPTAIPPHFVGSKQSWGYQSSRSTNSKSASRTGRIG